MAGDRDRSGLSLASEQTQIELNFMPPSEEQPAQIYCNTSISYSGTVHPGRNEQDDSELGTVTPKSAVEPPTPSPGARSWDEALKLFFLDLGLSQTLHGFETDILVMNPEYERNNVPHALRTMLQNLEKIDPLGSPSPQRSLDERKLDYAQHNNDKSDPPIQVQAQSSVIKSVSRFLAANRAKNEASNRNEFLRQSSPSCARTDAKFVERDKQMSYDIAKNEEGPLSKTVTALPETSTKKRKRDDGVSRPSVMGQESVATEERLENIEEHLAIKYVPSTPRTFHARLAFLEQHIANLEKQYPPWAALHFNQPTRGWPPPPRPTPIIVPPELRTSTAPLSGKDTNWGENSSLHRAVMDRLRVQNAMNDLSGVK